MKTGGHKGEKRKRGRPLRRTTNASKSTGEGGRKKWGRESGRGDETPRRLLEKNHILLLRKECQTAIKQHMTEGGWTAQRSRRGPFLKRREGLRIEGWRRIQKRTQKTVKAARARAKRRLLAVTERGLIEDRDEGASKGEKGTGPERGCHKSAK